MCNKNDTRSDEQINKINIKKNKLNRRINHTLFHPLTKRNFTLHQSEWKIRHFVTTLIIPKKTARDR